MSSTWGTGPEHRPCRECGALFRLKAGLVPPHFRPGEEEFSVRGICEGSQFTYKNGDVDQAIQALDKQLVQAVSVPSLTLGKPIAPPLLDAADPALFMLQLQNRIAEAFAEFMQSLPASPPPVRRPPRAIDPPAPASQRKQQLAAWDREYAEQHEVFMKTGGDEDRELLEGIVAAAYPYDPSLGLSTPPPQPVSRARRDIAPFVFALVCFILVLLIAGGGV